MTDRSVRSSGRTAVFRTIRYRRESIASESRLSDFYAAIVDSGSTPWRYMLRRPRATLAAAADVLALPTRRAELAGSRGGRVIVETLTRSGPLHLPVRLTGVTVLDIPADAADYVDGASKQTLRRKVRSALRSGISCRRVDDPVERAALLELARAAEATHADDRYRVEQPDNADLPDHDLWLAAFAADGTPLLLSVTPAEGDWAHLRYFRTLGSGQTYSDSRYLMTQRLVETLSALGVRHLIDGVHPADLPNGLRHFQRMVGFRLTRISLASRRT